MRVRYPNSAGVISTSFTLTGAPTDPLPSNDSLFVTTPLGAGTGVRVPAVAPGILALLALAIAALGVRAAARRG